MSECWRHCRCARSPDSETVLVFVLVAKGMTRLPCSVRFALLPEAEQRASWPATAGPFRALTSVQLRARHWIIRDLQGEVTGEFGGEALLGGHPILTAGNLRIMGVCCMPLCGTLH